MKTDENEPQSGTSSGLAGGSVAEVCMSAATVQVLGRIQAATGELVVAAAIAKAKEQGLGACLYDSTILRVIRGMSRNEILIALTPVDKPANNPLVP